MLIDTHVHLNHADLDADLAGVLARAAAAGVDRFVVIGYDAPSSARAIALAESDARLFAAVGIHPHDAVHWSDATAAQIRTWGDHERVVAIGEIGLDFYAGARGERTLVPPDVQHRAFVAQLDIAHALNLPVVIHCRDAYDETLDVLETHTTNDLPVILHCFQGTEAHAERAWARGWFLGVGGALTFRNQDVLERVVREAPEQSLLLETDAPYLSPAPLRGKYPNEPARVVLVAEKIAALRDEPLAAVADVTTANAHRAFSRLR